MKCKHLHKHVKKKFSHDNDEEEDDDDDEYNLNSTHENKTQDSDEKTYDLNNNNNNNNDLRNGPPPSGHPIYQSTSKMDSIITHVEKLKGRVQDSIDMVIDRGEEISLLQGKADEFSKESVSFRNRSRRVQYQYCQELYKQRCIIAFVAIFAIYLLSAMICGWSWDSCSN